MEKEMDRDSREQRHGGFRHILPFLVIPLAFGLMRGMARYKYGRMGEHRHEGWKDGVPPMFAELHRRAHAAEARTQGEKTAEAQAGPSANTPV